VISTDTTYIVDVDNSRHQDLLKCEQRD